MAITMINNWHGLYKTRLLASVLLQYLGRGLYLSLPLTLSLFLSFSGKQLANTNIAPLAWPRPLPCLVQTGAGSQPPAPRCLDPRGVTWTRGLQPGLLFRVPASCLFIPHPPQPDPRYACTEAGCWLGLLTSQPIPTHQPASVNKNFIHFNIVNFSCCVNNLHAI